MQVIQAITVIWSKRSRSGANARLRNSVPETFALPPNPRRENLYQEIRLSETDGFHTPETTIREFEGKKVNLFGCVRTQPVEDKLVVTYSYSDLSGGAPRRTSVPRQVMELAPGEWGQVIYNGRFSSEGATEQHGDWFYLKTVINVVNSKKNDREILTTTKPKKVFKDLAKLA